MTTKLRIIGVVIFCISASLIIPKVAGATVTFHRILSDTSHTTAKKVTNFLSYNVQDASSTYIPPNYGAPYSEYGTGTR